MATEFGRNGTRYPFDGDYPRKETIWYSPQILDPVPLETEELLPSYDTFDELDDVNTSVDARIVVESILECPNSVGSFVEVV